MSRDCCVVLPRGAMGLQFVIMVFPDHTHLLFLLFIQANVESSSELG